MRALAILVLTAGAALADEAAVPVIVGGDPDIDACSFGEVSGLNPDGDNFLALRAAPSTNGALLARLAEGQNVWLCDQTGPWIGVVVHDETGCGFGSPIAEARPYGGPCKSGWAHRDWIRQIAG